MSQIEEILRVAAKGDGVTESGRFAPYAAPGDLLIIATFAVYNEVELANYAPQLVYADANNRIARIGNGIPAQAA